MVWCDDLMYEIQSRSTNTRVKCWNSRSYLRLLPRGKYTVVSRSKRVIILANDTDIVGFIYNCQYLKNNGLRKIWIRGVGKTYWYIPLHSLADTIGTAICQQLPPMHCLTGHGVKSNCIWAIFPSVRNCISTIFSSIQKCISFVFTIIFKCISVIFNSFGIWISVIFSYIRKWCRLILSCICKCISVIFSSIHRCC